MRRLSLVPLLLAVVGCSGEGTLAADARRPEIHGSFAGSNPHNVLSAALAASVRFVDSVTVSYGLAGEALRRVTPAAVPAGGSVLVPVLGLFPDTTYALQALAYGGGQVVAGEVVSFRTGSLPDDLPTFRAGGPDPSPGFVVLAAGRYGLVIDNTGRVVWYRQFPNGPGLNFQAQPTGHFVARPPPSDPGQPAPWVEVDPLGRETRTLGCVGGLQPRFHDLLVMADRSYWVLCDQTRTMDLSDQGGVEEARVTGTAVQHVSAAGELLFEWDPFDHFEVAGLGPTELQGAAVNWTHGNALDLDTDGNLLVSFRNVSEIVKIDTRSGRVLWRMGGPRNEFTFQDTDTPAFLRQHGVRATGPGVLLLLDNLGDPAESRAERYAFDEQARTARLVGAFGPVPPVSAQLGGTVQDLPGGRTLVTFGSAGVVEEYDAAGNIMWRMDEPGYVFRAQRIESLYRPGIGSAR